MSCAPVNVLTPVISGDGWPGLPACSFSSTGTAFAEPLALVEMFWENKETGVIELTLSSAGEDPGITIDSAADWTFSVLPRVITLAAGAKSWSIRTTATGGLPRTRLRGTIDILDR